ncbi:putative pentatricopeptide repeat-containing protein At5g52630 [Punica granatum]|uniref:Pentatricopeptide repeat-containing protein At5g52630 n=2 Tax=Punica granatum TaxID=22663 RepID=A0A6P8E7B8_PUNGR|nr:putative pentatricopeptide repeat-containing protein At5g52630 [Punica granatum]
MILLLLTGKTSTRQGTRFLHTASSSSSDIPATPTHLNHLLNAVSLTKNLKHAAQIHAQIITNSFSSLPFLFNNLLNLYSKCGQVGRTLQLFSSTRDECKNIVSWTSLITQLSRSGRPFQALSVFNQMRLTGIFPNQFTFSAVLTACADIGVVFHGEEIHCLVTKHGFNSDVFVGSAMVDVYAKCLYMGSAAKVFAEMPERNLVTWNAMIVGFLQNKCYDRASLAIREVLREGSVMPDQVSFSSALSACANMGGLEFGRQLHGAVVKHNLIDLAYVKNSLMDVYTKCGSSGDAFKLFRVCSERDVVTWNVMMMGCVHIDSFEEACSYFKSMMIEGVLPDEASFSTVLHVCSNLSTLILGASVHDQIIKRGFEKNNCVRGSLITMYTKCGSLDDAHKVFKDIEDPNVVCWSAMIAAFQQHGCADLVVESFEKMVGKGIKPDYITLVSVLSACSHTGQVERGFEYFNSMTESCGIIPGSEHYACMVDLLGRAGRLHEAKRFIESMPIEPDSSVWGAILGASRNSGNLEMGRQAAEKLFELEPSNSGSYILLANMYSRAGMLKEADEIRRLMGMNRVRKETGCSWIDVKDRTFVFTSHDRSHSMSQDIYKMLAKMEELIKKKGYVAEIEFAVNSIGEHKERNLWHHSERLALAFALLTLPKGAPIRIKKNLRTCGDCHIVMKFASEIFERVIIVRDVNRFHRFANGICSCGDYW